MIEDKWVIGLGGYLTDFKTDASVGSGGVFGTFFRAEDELGIDKDLSVIRVDGLYRFNSRHALGAGFWSLNRDGRAVIDEQLEFDGDLFDVGADLNSEFDTAWFRVDWRYSLLRTDRGEAGFIAGLSLYEFEVGVEGLATVSDGMGGTTLELVRAEDELLAPVPSAGIFINYAIKPRLVFRGRAEFFDLEVDEFEGNLVDTALLLEWYFTQTFGLGIGTNTTDIEFRDTGDDPFAVDYRQTGLLAYFTFAF